MGPWRTSTVMRWNAQKAVGLITDPVRGLVLP